MMNNHEEYFTVEVPRLLAQLQEDTPRQFGTMDATKMLVHITAGAELMLSKRKAKLQVPEDKLPKLKAFLRSDKPILEGAKKPEIYHDFEGNYPQDFKTLKTVFLEKLNTFNEVTKTEKDFWCFHPIFGTMDAEETRQLQWKHLSHHFKQFGIA